MKHDYERLAHARQEAGYDSARSACEAFGWSYSTYAGHENGSRGFKRNADTYARAFRVNLDWLITGRGPMKGSDPDSAEIVDIWSRIPDASKGAARQMLESLTRKDEAG